MRAITFFLIACALAAAAPLLPRPSHAEPASRSAPEARCATVAFSGSRTLAQCASAAGAVARAWPARFEGRPLTELPLTGRDRRFADDFPGRIGRFSDGRREIIMRLTTQATRRLHPASDCLRAVGFAVEPQPARRGPDGTAWGCFIARKQGAGLTVCEQIRDAGGRTWPDPSSWYWPALTGGSPGPWWSTTIVEPR